MDYSSSWKLVDYNDIWVRRVPAEVHSFGFFLPLIAAISWKYFGSNGFLDEYAY